jgi:L-fuculokinase
MNNDIVIVLDCGATNIRAVAVNQSGGIEAIHSVPNNTRPDPNFPTGLIWDVNEIWKKFCHCTQILSRVIDLQQVKAIIVTTFGVNGAPVDNEGELLYPVISWQCQRMVPIMDNIHKYMPLNLLYQISGINKFSFNTINTLIWLKENQPQVLERMEGFLFMPSLFIHKMTGQLVNDVTMCGTSMLTDLKTRTFSEDILSKTGLPNRFFKIVETGTIVGDLQPKAAAEMGLTAGIKVVSGGHDTQLAMIGSGAGVDEAVLSSGTWEILMARSRHAELNQSTFEAGFTNEYDAVPGLFNSGAQWLGSGTLEWIRNMFYSKELETCPGEVYKLMIDEAEEVCLTNKKLAFNPDFVSESGIISGIGLNTSRQEIYRAAIETLVNKTKVNLDLMQQTGKFKAQSMIVVGGGSKNRLWNQLRANQLQIPVKIAHQTETTVLGAAMFGHVALGNYPSIDDATHKVCQKYDLVMPAGK